jgi:hypothetical protein
MLHLCPFCSVPPAAPLWRQTHSPRTDADVYADAVAIAIAIAEMPRVGGVTSTTHPEIAR